ncbi:CPBP family intramembrane metalloprotease [Dietzia natronolimnaea]|uniref:CPBP family intramembrane metalloprotease n=1 Tax=Dietzia natronolimnaea TaxID=161920 RepID=A0A2A2WU21_9ACTN|nr:type II CAAX endopeptidase family protein [Dietzia natronolimnaea]PAY24732.1 CPBP family intramembrane metalloprotease [Dietzia natronolimnaea]
MRRAVSPREAFRRYVSRFDPVTDPRTRRLLVVELVVVLLVTFGLAGLYSVLDLASALLAPEPLAGQTATLNPSRSTHAWLDVAYQLLAVLRLLAWSVLPLVLLAHTGLGPRAVGLARDRAGRQIAWGIALAAVIGIPGLAFYLGAVAAGINLQVAGSGLTETWWRPIVLVLSAAGNGAAEEILVVGYLLVRLRQLGIPPAVALVGTALLRGSYHLYQGFGGGLGNLAMGIVFALWWMRTRRLWPLILAHTLLDVVAFVGYAVLAPHVAWL